jgi:hypothetical protein
MRRWKHKIGDCVDHMAGAMTAIVLGRTKTLAGNENYDVRLVDLSDARRDRVISGRVTTTVKFFDKRCSACRFRIGDVCCRNMQ